MIKKIKIMGGALAAITSCALVALAIPALLTNSSQTSVLVGSERLEANTSDSVDTYASTNTNSSRAANTITPTYILLSGPDFNNAVKDMGGEENLRNIIFKTKESAATMKTIVANEAAVDVSEQGDKSIMAVFDNSTVTISSAGSIIANANCAGMFKDMEMLGNIDGWDNEVDKSNIYSLNGAFQNTSLVAIPSLAGCKVWDMTNAFKDCAYLTGTMPINDGFVYYSGCFAGTYDPIALTGTSSKLDAIAATSTKDNIAVTKNDPTAIEYGATVTVNNYTYTYYGVDGGWSVSVKDKNKNNYGNIPETVTITYNKVKYTLPVTDLDNTFKDCVKLSTAPTIPSSVTTMNHTFDGCIALKTAPVIPKSVMYMKGTFQNCTALTSTAAKPVTINAQLSNKSDCANCFNGTTQPIVLDGYNMKIFAETASNGNVTFN